MANIYLKKVASSSRSEWVSGTSYVAGDRVYLSSATIENVHATNGTTFPAVRTFVCLVDNSSTTSPEDDTTNWIEAGISKEYPYHSIDGALDSNAIGNEIYLESEATRYATTQVRGSTYYHLRRGETEYSLGKLIIVSDTESNPVFKINTRTTIMGFAIEPDKSIERFSIVCIGANTSLGSNGAYNDNDSQYGKIDKCDIYFSGTGTYLVGGIYNNSNKIEFTDCLFLNKPQKSDMQIAPLQISGLANVILLVLKGVVSFFHLFHTKIDLCMIHKVTALGRDHSLYHAVCGFNLMIINVLCKTLRVETYSRIIYFIFQHLLVNRFKSITQGQIPLMIVLTIFCM